MHAHGYTEVFIKQSHTMSCNYISKLIAYTYIIFKFDHVYSLKFFKLYIIFRILSI